MSVTPHLLLLPPPSYPSRFSFGTTIVLVIKNATGTHTMSICDLIVFRWLASLLIESRKTTAAFDISSTIARFKSSAVCMRMRTIVPCLLQLPRFPVEN